MPLYGLDGLHVGPLVQFDAVTLLPAALLCEDFHVWVTQYDVVLSGDDVGANHGAAGEQNDAEHFPNLEDRHGLDGSSRFVLFVGFLPRLCFSRRC